MLSLMNRIHVASLCVARWRGAAPSPSMTGFWTSVSTPSRSFGPTHFRVYPLPRDGLPEDGSEPLELAFAEDSRIRHRRGRDRRGTGSLPATQSYGSGRAKRLAARARGVVQSFVEGFPDRLVVDDDEDACPHLMRENPVRGYDIPSEKNPRRPIATTDRYEAIRC